MFVVWDLVDKSTMNVLPTCKYHWLLSTSCTATSFLTSWTVGVAWWSSQAPKPPFNCYGNRVRY